jgi:hypothetical protein
MFIVFIVEIITGIVCLALAIQTSIDVNNAADFKDVYNVIPCNERTIREIVGRDGKPFYQLESNETAARNCYYYKHLPDELIAGEPKTVSPVLICMLIVFIFIFVLLGGVLKLGKLPRF